MLSFSLTLLYPAQFQPGLPTSSEVSETKKRSCGWLCGKLRSLRSLGGSYIIAGRAYERVHLSTTSLALCARWRERKTRQDERLARRESAHVWRGCVGESGSKREERAEGEEGSREPSKLGSRAVQKQERSQWVDRFLLATHNSHHPLSTTPYSTYTVSPLPPLIAQLPRAPRSPLLPTFRSAHHVAHRRRPVHLP